MIKSQKTKQELWLENETLKDQQQNNKQPRESKNLLAHMEHTEKMSALEKVHSSGIIIIKSSKQNDCYRPDTALWWATDFLESIRHGFKGIT